MELGNVSAGASCLFGFEYGSSVLAICAVSVVWIFFLAYHPPLSLSLSLSLSETTARCRLKYCQTELEIKGGIKDRSKIIFLISQRKHMW